MTYLILHADAAITALTDDPIVAASDVPTFASALALLTRAGALYDDSARRAAKADEAGHAEGFERGRQEGRAAAEAETRAELFRLVVRDAEQRATRRDEIATLAIEVVRRIAADIGEEAFVAAIADRATASLAADTAAIVKVAPRDAEAVRARLSERSALAVEADATLAPGDCIVETPLGRTHAGLETQLAQIDKAWTEARHGR